MSVTHRHCGLSSYFASTRIYEHLLFHYVLNDGRKHAHEFVKDFAFEKFKYSYTRTSVLVGRMKKKEKKRRRRREEETTKCEIYPHRVDI